MSVLEKVKDELISLRRELHKNPDTSNNETGTAKRLIDYIKKYNPDEIIEDIGGSGILFLYKGTKPGKTLFLRAELDALPLKETGDLAYKSQRENSAHLCGHDGHMTILSGLAPLLDANRTFSGTVGLLFQPAEETGEGEHERLHSLAEELIERHAPGGAVAHAHG